MMKSFLIRLFLMALMAGLFIFPEVGMSLEIKSSAFEDGGYIPERYTGQGEDISPDLSWGDMPDGTKSFALVMDDPDAPMGTWIHWVLFDIPEGTTGLKSGIPATPTLSNGARQGMNSFRSIGYGGPHPPRGPAHRYEFRLYALDTVLDLPPASTKGAVMRAMQGHVLADAILTGMYARK